MKHAIGLILILLYSQLAFSGHSDSDSTKTISNKLSISGYIDVYYTYNFNTPENASNFGTTGIGRIFDGYHNQFALGLAQTKFDYGTEKSNIVVDLVFGPNAELANFGNIGTAIAIKQAYFSTEITKNLQVTLGQFGTHIGYELIDAPDNFNYSLSYLFGNGPFYHTGLKLDYTINDKIGIMAGVLNGWDNIQDNNDGKSIALQLSIAPVSGWDIYVNWIGGDEMPEANNLLGLKSYKNMVDLTTTYQVNDQFLIGVNAAAGNSKLGISTTKWNGAALYLNYDISSKLGMGFRGEFFDDSEQTQYLGTEYMGFTLTGSFSPNDHIMVKPEFRLDNADDDIYFKGDNNNVVNTQSTFGIAVIALL